ncbi:hypothetical protein [Arenibacterium sp. LLYu02]|uniref:hypothetical protein n=1 Tax=Arenibacterium sp. LLYu02 TaxID=3404132 RepID=UPI003B2182A3
MDLPNMNTANRFHAFSNTLVLLGAGALCFFGVDFYLSEASSFNQWKKEGNFALLSIDANGGLAPLPRSYVRQTAALEMCNEALIAPIKPFYEAASVRMTAEACRAQAQKALAGTPSWGLAHFSLARAEFESGNREASIAAYVVSGQTAPNEGWITQKRVLLALDIGIDDAVRPVFEQDIRLLLSEPRLAAWLAQVYLALPQHRDAIVTAAETGSQNDKAKFLSSIRRTMRAAS